MYIAPVVANNVLNADLEAIWLHLFCFSPLCVSEWAMNYDVLNAYLETMDYNLLSLRNHLSHLTAKLATQRE